MLKNNIMYIYKCRFKNNLIIQKKEEENKKKKWIYNICFN